MTQMVKLNQADILAPGRRSGCAQYCSKLNKFQISPIKNAIYKLLFSIFLVNHLFHSLKNKQNQINPKTKQNKKTPGRLISIIKVPITMKRHLIRVLARPDEECDTRGRAIPLIIINMCERSHVVFIPTPLK